MLKNKGLMAVMAILLSLVIVYNIRFFSQRTRRSNLASSIEDEEEKTSEIIESSSATGGNHRPEDKGPLSPFWGRNPFFLPGEEKLARSFFLTASSNEETAVESREGQKEEAKNRKMPEEEWSLTAIIYHETSSRAIINHEPVQEGDTLSGEETKVIKIMPDRVILNREGKTSILKLGVIVPRETNTSEENEPQEK